MQKGLFFLFCFFVFSQHFFSQNSEEKIFSEIRKTYEKKAIDDVDAMVQVCRFIGQAKRTSNVIKLLQGYRDGRQFDKNNKLAYADSAIAVSLKYGTKNDISRDYLSKGIIYYFYQKKYKLALDEYLKAYNSSKGSTDQYLQHKVIYHLGVVKVHLGYYEEALEHFQYCNSFYKTKLSSALLENEKFNYKKAYYNSLHQLSVVNRYLKNFKISDSLSHLGYQLTLHDNDFKLENSYFLKCKGISKFHTKNYSEALRDLKQSLTVIQLKGDFAWASVIYYYMGRVYMAQNDKKNAIASFNNIDSIFVNHYYIVPEVYSSYNFLIENYKNNNLKKQLYYTNQLLKADSVIAKDYVYLSSKLHKDYDRQILIDNSESLELAGKNRFRVALFVILITVLLLVFFILRYRKDLKIKKQYYLLQKKLSDQITQNIVTVDEEAPQYSLRKTFLAPEITSHIETKLKKFETELQFRKKGLTQKSIAAKLDTNSHYLSIYINENKGMNFNKYMAYLRINYITSLLNSESKYLNYRMDALAEECGIASRTNFSNLFYEINGIRPGDFIKKRKAELGIS